MKKLRAKLPAAAGMVCLVLSLAAPAPVAGTINRHRGSQVTVPVRVVARPRTGSVEIIGRRVRVRVQIDRGYGVAVDSSDRSDGIRHAWLVGILKSFSCTVRDAVCAPVRFASRVRTAAQVIARLVTRITVFVFA